MEDTEAVWMFHCTLFLHFLLFSFDWISARYNDVGAGFTTHQWRWSFPVRQIRRKVAIERTDRLLGLWVRPIVYIGALFHSVFPLLRFGYTLALAAQEVCA